ncbi:MAG: NADH-quinone oxidoreductase subunit L [Deinococcales bacterium]
MNLSYAWLVPLLPALAFLVNILLGYRLGKRGAAYLSLAAMILASLIATSVLFAVYRAAPRWEKVGVYEIIEFEKAEYQPLYESYREALQRGAGEGRLEQLRHNLHQLEDDLHHLIEKAQSHHPAEGFPFTSESTWLSIQGEEGIPWGMLLDPFAALMLFMVAFVSMLIHLFSIEYMAGEDRYPTFFAYISLFSAAMLAMVLSRNLFHVLLFWEVMGVMSYLLIGFFYKKISAQQAMKKAFLVTKLADIGLIIGLALIYRHFGTLDIVRLHQLAPELLAAAPAVATAIGLLLFIGAMGKSAQFPLHIWLLDAMEGPTPVSAMIHAATMVAAGVYLMARAHPLITLGAAPGYIATIGAITALFAAMLAPAFADIKKILAWSTVSQLGFMFIALGSLGWFAAVFHLIAHAFFKALLFLCSGSMIHGSGTQDIFEMDKLAKHMPSTRISFIIGGLSLAGIVPFAGFWSKDEVLLALKHAASDNWGYGILLLMAYAASLLTAFYIARAYFIAFEKPSQPSPWAAASWNQGALAELNMSAEDVKQDKAHDHHHLHHPPHESGLYISLALWLLAGSATVIGLLGSPIFGNALQRFVYQGHVPHLEPLAVQIPGFIIGTVIAVTGIGLAYLLYGGELLKLRAPEALTQVLQKRFYLDELAYKLIANPLTQLRQLLAHIDRHYLDRAIDLGAWLVQILADALRRLQTGRLEHYLWTIAAAALAIVLFFSLSSSTGGL